MADAMDSKSISREGVGVQVPASAPPRAASSAEELAASVRGRLEDDPYLRAALPALVHRVNNATQILTGLNALLSLPGGAELFATRASDLAAVSEVYDRSGWLLAVFGSALGAATLSDRRERDGLVPVVELARELARRRGRELEFSGALPSLEPRAGLGFELPWAVGAWMHGALLATPDGARVRFVGTDRRGAWSLTDDAPIDAARAELARRIEARVPGSAHAANEARIDFDARWFARSDAR